MGNIAPQTFICLFVLSYIANWWWLLAKKRVRFWPHKIIGYHLWVPAFSFFDPCHYRAPDTLFKIWSCECYFQLWFTIATICFEIKYDTLSYLIIPTVCQNEEFSSDKTTTLWLFCVPLYSSTALWSEAVALTRRLWSSSWLFRVKQVYCILLNSKMFWRIMPNRLKDMKSEGESVLGRFYFFLYVPQI